MSSSGERADAQLLARPVSPLAGRLIQQAELDRAVFTPGTMGVAILDGARSRAIEPMIRLGRAEYLCLFSGKLTPRMEAAAAYAVRLEPGTTFTRELMSSMWGKAWGILASVDENATMPEVRRHLRRFLRVGDEEGKTYYFRFYDPRVLRAYVPTCTNAEFAAFLGPMKRVIAETGSAGSEGLVFERAWA
ncbi:MAG: DUF4123 domain-containing protein [Planctomycetota bacterium]|nr:DUF4123 domain-containing protein [Planctomycetota bacterium]